MKLLGAGSLAAALLLLLTACGDSAQPAASVVADANDELEAKRVEVGDDDDAAFVQVGDTLVVRLTENLSTGHAWRFNAGTVDSRYLRLVSDTSEADPTCPPPPVTGCGGFRVFTFSVVGAVARTTLNIDLMRPGGQVVARTKRLVVNISAATAPGQIELGMDDSSAAVDAGTQFRVRLPENLSTGRAWRLDEGDGFDSRYLRLVSDSSEADPACPPPPMTGCGGFRVLTFEAISAVARTRINIDLMAPGGATIVDSKSYVITVR